MNMRTEPVRLIAIITGMLSALGTCLVSIGQGVDPLVSAGTALIAAAVVIGGGELARSQAYSPKTAEDIMDADTFLRDLEV